MSILSLYLITFLHRVLHILEEKDPGEY